ncbi:hypothetical protein [Dictyobacter aurantiacus]|uniref:Uncharacterized protein n=1 Tax=Dictyobacter aurantiacus TaxID=1936993 RepID=A0A401ZCK3_9CHLR|nr:hypothetical protein [Dictyobacter aurantiacus]GCE04604.1 hypothetical protein KDAU_19330 [Dictyobacter aurantiacus]
MQEYQPRFRFARRVLFPYTGEEPLTRAQEVRVIVSWATIFPVALLVGTLPIVALFSSNASLQKIALILLLVFVGGVVIFGLMAWFVVFMINRSARLFQLQRQRAQKSAGTSDFSGGRYGS